MKQLNQIIQHLNQYRLDNPDQWAALTLFIGVFALILAIVAIKRSNRPRVGSAVTRESVTALESKLESEQVRREQSARDLSGRVIELEARIEELEIALAKERHKKSEPASVETRELKKPAPDIADGATAEVASVEQPTAASLPIEPVPEIKPALAETVTALQPEVRVEVPRPKPAAVEQYVPTSLTIGLKKTRVGFFGKLRGLLGGGRKAALDEVLPGLEELLLSSDLGVKTADKLVQTVRQKFDGAAAQSVTEEAVTAVLKSEIERILESPVDPDIEWRNRVGGPLVIVVVGVNGVGKTTTIGKLAAKFKVTGAKVLLGACDTFRAAAVEQLKSWADRTGCEIVSGDENTKPSTVAYQAVARARQDNFDVLIIDTAGRLHTRSNLMNELEGVVKIISREYPGSPHETILVLDASTGQNALTQAREFNQRAELTGVVVTKLDGTPKGGIIVAIKEELGVPIRYIGIGEGIGDLRPFSASEFAEALFESGASENDEEAPAEQVVSARAAVRRRRREGEV